MEKLTMTVKEVGETLNISYPTAVKLTNSTGFPVVRVGKRKLIPVFEFKKWLSSQAQQQKAVTSE